MSTTKIAIAMTMAAMLGLVGHVSAIDLANWTQVGADIDGEAYGDLFGASVSLSADGSTVAAGAPDNKGSGFTGGHVRVFNYGIFWDGFESGDTSAWSASTG